MTENSASKILQILKETLGMPNWTKSKRDPFETLVVTIISQNTADLNTARAFEKLSSCFEISPEGLAKAPTEDIEEAIRSAGLFKSKAQTIKQAAIIVLNQFHGSLAPLLSLPLDEARESLIQFPGVGPKTADVVLLFSYGKSTIPVDTHVNRVSKRLGFVSMEGNYECVRNGLQKIFNPSDYLKVHLLLIAHGRKICRARYPLCEVCPVNMYCPTRGQWG